MPIPETTDPKPTNRAERRRRRRSSDPPNPRPADAAVPPQAERDRAGFNRSSRHRGSWEKPGR